MRKSIVLSLLTIAVMLFSCEKEPVTESVPTTVDAEEIARAELALKQPGLEDSKSNLNAKFGITKTKADVNDFVNGGVVGSATLFRSNNGVFLIFYSDALLPHHTYTIWWAAWNGPEFCAVPEACGLDLIDFANAAQTKPEFMYATGRVASLNGKALFWAYLGENDASGSVNDLFGLPPAGGLLDAQTAQVQAILRSHGPAIPGMVLDQISSYLGGCTTLLDAFSEIPDEEGECADIYAAIFPI